MLNFLKRAYFSIGIHTAPRGTLLYRVNKLAVAAYGKMVGRGLIAPWQGSAARVASRTAVRRAVPRGISGNYALPADVVVAFRISGGFGDHVLAARYIRDLLAAAGDFRFDIYSNRPDDAALIFRNFSQLNECHDEYFSWERNFASYPLAMYVTLFALVYADTADWRRVGQTNSRLRAVCEKLDRFKPEIEPFIAEHPLFDGFLARKFVFMNLKRHTALQAISGIAYGGDRFPIAADADALRKFELEAQTYLTIHNGFDTDLAHRTGDGKKATKCYPHFDAVVAGLRQRFPGLRLVQLGTGTSAPVKGVEHNLIGRTTLEEAAGVLQNSLLHIDIESGLVHLAASLGAKACVLFGPTDADFFAYDGNINLRSGFCGGCWWVTKDWLSKCPRGFAEPRCLSELKPDMVIEAVAQHLSTTRKMKVYEGDGDYPAAIPDTHSVPARKTAG